MDILRVPSPIQEIFTPTLDTKRIRLFIKRDDLIHSEISGNKWRKLKFNMEQMVQHKKKGMLTFGGAFSNHIYATAAAGKSFDFRTVGVIRGENIDNPTLHYAQEVGMELEFVTRTQYRDKEKLTTLFREKYPDYWMVPEGGTNEYALPGCAEMVREINTQFKKIPDYIALAVGTGGTISGLLTGLNGQSSVIGVSALKGDFHQKDIKELLTRTGYDSFDNWGIWTDYHFGGYAKIKPELISFIQDFYKKHKVPLEPIYTGKLCYAIFDKIEQGYFPEGSQILIIHTGGLQGVKGIEKRYGIKLYPEL